MKRLMIVMLSVLFAAGMKGVVIAGSLDSPGAPSAGSGMYTLQNLYDYLTSGAALTVQTNFQEPTSAPGSTMKTAKEIGDGVKALYDQCLVTAADVKSGVTFFCTQPGSWGVRTGTAQLVPTPTPTTTPTITPTATPTWGQARCEAKGGYWALTQLTGSDAYGCWFSTVSSETCTAACQNLSPPLTCMQKDWDDDTSCSVMVHMRSMRGNCNGTMGCRTDPMSGTPEYNCEAGGESYRRGTGASQQCGGTENNPTLRRACVCEP